MKKIAILLTVLILITGIAVAYTTVKVNGVGISVVTRERANVKIIAKEENTTETGANSVMSLYDCVTDNRTFSKLYYFS